MFMRLLVRLPTWVAVLATLGVIVAGHSVMVALAGHLLGCITG